MEQVEFHDLARQCNLGHAQSLENTPGELHRNEPTAMVNSWDRPSPVTASSTSRATSRVTRLDTLPSFQLLTLDSRLTIDLEDPP
jgi:hypothetical protein